MRQLKKVNRIIRNSDKIVSGYWFSFRDNLDASIPVITPEAEV